MDNESIIWPVRHMKAIRGTAMAILVLWMNAASAVTPTPYGENFAKYDSHWSDAGPVPLETGLMPPLQDLAPYQLQVETLEQENGPYASILAEPLIAMAHHYRHTGDPEQAVRLYQRALHVVRVNDGLYSERQIPFLRGLLDTYRETAQWEILDQRYDYFFRLYGGGRPPFTELRLRAALEYLRWQREAFRLKVGDAESDRLLDMIDLNAEVIDAVSVDLSVSYSFRRDLALSQLRNFYLLQDGFAPKIEDKGLLTTSKYIGTMPAEGSISENRLDAIQRAAVPRASEPLEALLSTARSEGVKQHAALQLELADWLHWNGSRQKAQAAYQVVVEILRSAGEQALLEQWLGQPVELPDNGSFYQPPGKDPNQPGVVLEARYDVSVRGKPSNIQVRQVSGSESRSLYRFKRDLDRTRFRPRWAGGQAEASKQVERSYRVFD